MSEPEARREQHHLIGCKDGKAEGCAHSDTELRNYINFGRISNPNCPAIKRWNRPMAQQVKEQGK